MGQTPPSQKKPNINKKTMLKTLSFYLSVVWSVLLKHIEIYVSVCYAGSFKCSDEGVSQ